MAPARCASHAAFAAVALALLGTGCGGPPIVQGPADEFQNPPTQPGSNTARVATMMTGSFTSAAQAAANPSYFDVHLHVTPIWTDRSDGPWLYIEQAMATAPTAPYRQRVYRLVDQGRGVVESIVYGFPGNPLAFAGAWRDPARLNALDPSLLLPRMGCSVLLMPRGPDEFVGRTHGTECLSDLKGAAYATSEVTLRSGTLESWDRGYDAAGQQVWGATSGPYIFVKQEEGSQ